MRLCDTHCHFFSSRFLEILTKDLTDFPADDRADAVAARLGWEAPGPPKRSRIAGSPSSIDSASREACSSPAFPATKTPSPQRWRSHPARFVGFFMFNPLAPDAATRLAHALGEQRMRGIALFPAMHRYRLDDDGGCRRVRVGGVA